jgi:hypothetical protein
MNVLDMESDMVPSLARDQAHTSESIASRQRAEPHQRPWLAKDSAEPGSWRPTHKRVWLIGTRAEQDSYVYGHMKA